MLTSPAVFKQAISLERIGRPLISHEAGVAHKWEFVKNKFTDQYWIQESIQLSNDNATSLHHISMDLYPKNVFIYQQGDIVVLMGRYVADLNVKRTSNLLVLYEKLANSRHSHNNQDLSYEYKKRCSTLDRLGPLDAQWFYFHERSQNMVAIKQRFPFPELLILSATDCSLVSFFLLSSNDLGMPIIDEETDKLYFPFREIKNGLNARSFLGCVSLPSSELTTDFPITFETFPIPREYSLDLNRPCIVATETTDGNVFTLLCSQENGKVLKSQPQRKLFREVSA